MSVCLYVIRILRKSISHSQIVVAPCTNYPCRLLSYYNSNHSYDRSLYISCFLNLLRTLFLLPLELMHDLESVKIVDIAGIPQSTEFSLVKGVALLADQSLFFSYISGKVIRR